MADTEMLLKTVVFWCLPDYEAAAASAISQTASGYVRIPEPLPKTVSSVQSYLCRRGNRLPTTQTLKRSWDCFYRQYHPLVQWLIARFCRQTDQDDISQEIWTEIIVELPKLTDGSIQGKFSSWLSGLTRRKIFRLVHQQCACGPPELLSIENIPLTSSDLGPDEECLFNEMLDQLDVILTNLQDQTSPENCDLFCRKFFGGKSAKQIAIALDLTPNIVRYRYHRLKRKWQELTRGTMLEEWEEDVRMGKKFPLPRKPR